MALPRFWLPRVHPYRPLQAVANAFMQLAYVPRPGSRKADGSSAAVWFKTAAGDLCLRGA